MPPWVIPLLYTGVSFAAALVVPRIEHALGNPFEAGISIGSAVAVLSAIASGMMALTGIVFSVAFVMVQFSAIAYSPRFAARFARDPLLFHALGVFFATFTYALAATAWIDREGSGHMPSVSIAIAVLLLLGSLAVFGMLIRRLGDLQIGSTLRYIGDRGREVIAQGLGAATAGPREATAARDPAPVTQVLRHDDTPRCVQSFDIAALVALAREAGGRIEMRCAVGDMMLSGTVLLEVMGGAALLPEARLRAGVRLGGERTFEQDPKYSLRLLVDIAIKALSPAINDPTTAVQALDQIDDLLRRLARADLGDGLVADAQGVLRLVFPVPLWSDYLSLAFDEIRAFGGTSLQVLRRLRSALAGLEELLEGSERAEEVRRYLRHMDSAIESSAFDAQDRIAARQQDPQGLGLTR